MKNLPTVVSMIYWTFDKHGRLCERFDNELDAKYSASQDDELMNTIRVFVNLSNGQMPTYDI